MYQYIGFLVLALFHWVKHSAGHGRLVDPPSRSSMWRYGFKNPPNYNDNQLYCGGVQVQYNLSGGKCGVCGDPWPGPRENEEGGKYANGIIVRTYDRGEVITITVELTASHKGYFEFKLCPRDDPLVKTTQQCLDSHVLQLAEGSGTKFYLKSTDMHQILPIKVRLPENVKCRDCTLQWKYNAGNSWGQNEYGTGCLGCGNQEQFYGCADIAIGYDDIEEGDSLITGENYKKENYIPPPPPIIPATTDTDTTNMISNWGDLTGDIGGDIGEDTDQTTSFWDALVSGDTKVNTDNKVLLFEEFQKFQKMFKNKNIRPCVCHSCVGNTCVCECVPVPSHAYSFMLKGVNEWLMYITSVISCLIPLVLL